MAFANLLRQTRPVPSLQHPLDLNALMRRGDADVRASTQSKGATFFPCFLFPIPPRPVVRGIGAEMLAFWRCRTSEECRAMRENLGINMRHDLLMNAPPPILEGCNKKTWEILDENIPMYVMDLPNGRAAARGL